MADLYASVDDYIRETGDERSDPEVILSKLTAQSAKLRAKTGIHNGQHLSEDQQELCKDLVIDAVRKALDPPTLEGFCGPLTGASTAMFSANGFQQSVTLQNPSGVAYFDRDTLNALKATLGRRQCVGTIMPRIGG